MNDGNWLSPVRIVESSILGLRLDINHGFQGEASGMKFTLNTNFEDVEEADAMHLLRGVIEAVQTVSDADDSELMLFTTSCSVGIRVGIHKESVPEGTSNDKLKSYLQANALSLGYGKIRSIIEDITAESVIGRVTTPPINPQAYMDLVAEKMTEEEEPL